jgi:tryptophan synthase alpha chain
VSRLAAAFETARAERRAVLVGYLPAGFPTVDGGVAAIQAMVDGGVDVVEVGLPYSDPLMDGPVIQSAVDQALRVGTTTRDVMDTVRRVAAGSGPPTLVMTYWNPVERYGTDRFAADLAAAGGVGVITPDLTPEEAGDWLAAVDRHDLDPVFLVAPSSTDARLRCGSSASTPAALSTPRRPWASPAPVTSSAIGPRNSSGGSAASPTSRSPSASACRPARRPRRSLSTPTA